MNMREKIARAMWECNRKRCAEQGIVMDPWDDENEALHADWLAFVDAGLDALREPTPEMILARHNFSRSVCRGDVAEKFPDSGEFEAMIDAAKAGR